MRRKILSLLLVLALLCALAPQLTLSAKAAASGVCGDNLTWSFDAGSGTLTISGYGDMYDFEDYDYYSEYNFDTGTYVLSHYSTIPWYDYAWQIKELRLPDGLTGIGDSAFSGCVSLRSVTIPDGVTDIRWNAFSGCSGLESVSIPFSVTEIFSGAFSRCTSLYSVNIPGGVLYLDGHTFQNCTSLNTITVSPDNPYYCSVDGILFSKDGSVLVVYPGGKPGSAYSIPEGVTRIGSGAFLGCFRLQTITIPDSVREIEYEAFSECHNLQSINIPNSVIRIDSMAFAGCINLQTITIPDSVKEIESGAFTECRSLRSVIIPEGVTSLNQDMFSECISLRSVTIPSTVKDLGDLTFSGCNSLENVTIPEGVTRIGFYAFYGCSSLQYISVPESVEEIGSNAFGNTAYYNNPNYWLNGLLYAGNWVVAAVSDLSSANIRPGTVGIADRVFDYWGNELLTSVTLPDGLKYIGEDAFYYCEQLSNVNLPDSVRRIGFSAFYGTAYYNNPNKWLNGLLYLGNWLIGTDPEIVSANIRPGTIGIADGVMSTREKLIRVTLPDGLRFIGEQSFLICERLTEITIPDSVESIGAVAFHGCSSLKNLEIPYGVTAINDGVFDGCSSLTSITIPNTVTSIGRDAFWGCSSLTNLTIPDSVKTIDRSAFSGCHSLQAMVVPESVTNIGEYAFDWCSNLKSILILNRNCAIYEDDFTLNYSEFTTVFGYPGSTAEAYAKEYGYTFKNVEEIDFIDVADNVYYTEPVAWAVENGVTTGTAPYLFSPDSTCTRAQVVTFLWRAAGSPEPENTFNPFADVKSDAYYYKAVLWAVENGITTGTSSDKFSPDAGCTRAQVVTFLWRARGEPEPEFKENPFQDMTLDEYYSMAVLWAVENSITNGTAPDRFSPASTCTRAQIVTFLYRDLA